MKPTKSTWWWIPVAGLAAVVLGASTATAANGSRQCTDPCLQAARAELRTCASSATGAFHDAFDACVDGARTCVDACRSSRQECRDATSLGEDLLACRLDLDAALEGCRERFPIGSVRRTICIDRARAASSRCQIQAARREAAALRQCRTDFRDCAGSCAPGEPSGGGETCREDGKAAVRSDLAACRRAHRVTVSACINKDVTCVQECVDAREDCTAPTRATLDAAIASCTAQLTAALAVCQSANPNGGSPLEQCVTAARANATACRDAALDAAEPGLASCAADYISCVRGCPAPAPEARILEDRCAPRG